MTRKATFTGTILIVAGFVATAIAAEPESSDTSERFKERPAGIDRGVSLGKVTAEDADTFAVEIVTLESVRAAHGMDKPEDLWTIS